MSGNGRRLGDDNEEVEARRTEILRSLGAVLRETRMSSLRMQDIADRLGLTKGSLYYYFRNKQDILYQCHMRTMAGTLKVLETVEAMRGSCAERLHRLLVLHIRHTLDDSYGAVLLTDLEHLEPQQRAEYVALRDRFEQGVRKLIGDGMAAGEFPPRNVVTAGFAILGGVNWISKWYSPDGPETSDAIAACFADIYVGGLRAPVSDANATKARGRKAAATVRAS
jgi:AcrR family transcriptional regulator